MSREQQIIRFAQDEGVVCDDNPERRVKVQSRKQYRGVRCSQ
jgi:hypothetical protein